MRKRDIKLGDIITFKSPTRDGARKARRVVVGFTHHGYPEVRYNGWDRFVVYPREVMGRERP